MTYTISYVRWWPGSRDRMLHWKVADSDLKTGKAATELFVAKVPCPSTASRPLELPIFMQRGHFVVVCCAVVSHSLAKNVSCSVLLSLFMTLFLSWPGTSTPSLWWRSLIADYKWCQNMGFIQGQSFQSASQKYINSCYKLRNVQIFPCKFIHMSLQQWQRKNPWDFKRKKPPYVLMLSICPAEFCTVWSEWICVLVFYLLKPFPRSVLMML